MAPAILEANKKPGVCYALTDDGLELPVIDVTHPAFLVKATEEELSRLLEQSVSSTRAFRKMPGVARWLVTRLVLGQGVLTRGISRANGSYLSGLATYLLKLGPDNLGDGWAKKIDRTVSATLPAVAARLRLQDMARLLAEGLVAWLSAAPERPLLFLNIAGGPAADSFNALLLLQRDHPGLLAGRRIVGRVLDLDEPGPRFGARAVEALSADGKALHGLDVRFEHVSYDWGRPEDLKKVLDVDDGIIACSSEGGLFEYGTDDEVVGNLRELRERSPERTMVVGSVTRVDEPARTLHEAGGAALRLRGLPAFERLAGAAGWKLAECVDGPLSHNVCLSAV